MPLDPCPVPSLPSFPFPALQAKSLEFLQSTGLSIGPVTLDLDADGEAPPALPASSRPATGTKGGAAAAAPPGKGAPPVAAEALAKDIDVVIEACNKEIGVLARAYYAVLFPAGGAGGSGATAAAAAAAAAKKPGSPPPGAKKGGLVPPAPNRPIRYPGRIPGSVDLMLEQTGRVLEGLREQLRAHVAAGVKELRTQVREGEEIGVGEGGSR